MLKLCLNFPSKNSKYNEIQILWIWCLLTLSTWTRRIRSQWFQTAHCFSFLLVKFHCAKFYFKKIQNFIVSCGIDLKRSLRWFTSQKTLEITKIVCKHSIDQTGVLCIVLHVGDLVLVLNRSNCLLAKNSITYTKGIHCSVSLIC